MGVGQNGLLMQCNGRAMSSQICNIKPEDVASLNSRELLAKLELEDLDLILKANALQVLKYGHVEHSSGAAR